MSADVQPTALCGPHPPVPLHFLRNNGASTAALRTVDHFGLWDQLALALGACDLRARYPVRRICWMRKRSQLFSGLLPCAGSVSV